jgi:acetylglutamate kinase
MTDEGEEKNLRQLARWRQTGRVLVEALPFILQYDQKTIVVKYGGNAMAGAGTDDFSQDIVLMKQTGIDPVVVHGGGPQIGAMLKKLDIQSRFIDGLRVTDQAAVEVVEMVLTGSINKQIVTSINAAGGRAVGLSGKDGNLVIARKLDLKKTDPVTGETIVQDLGFVGEPQSVNPEVLHPMLKSEIIPVIAPIGVGPKGETYNINADTVAGALAEALHAEKLIFLTDVEGLRVVPDDPTTLIHQASLDVVAEILRGGGAVGGMKPKIEACAQAVRGGVDRAHILDGRVPHALLLELFTDSGVGTMVLP